MRNALIAGLALCGLLLASEPLRVGSSEQQLKLVKKVMPVYPWEAKANGIQGKVRLQATLDKDGAVKALVTLSGPEELVPPSVEAVKQWVYEPTLVNGERVEVITDIDLNYKLDK